MSGRNRSGPYMGPDSFELADRPFFFGRRIEQGLVTVLIESERLSVLTGPAGCGKSSLLKTGVLPDLLHRGWAVAYAQPGRDPASEMAYEISQQTRPRAEIERAAIAFLNENLREIETLAEPEMPATIADAQKWFAGIAADDPRRSRLLAPGSGKIQRVPLLSQAVLGLIDDLGLIRRILPQPILARLPARFGRAAPANASRLDKIIRRVEKFCPITPPDAPSADLVREINRFMADMPLERGYRGLVLVLDQAEELFTRFGEQTAPGQNSLPGIDGANDWRVRERFFATLRQALEMVPELPLRVCISLRPEWFTALALALRDLAPPESSVHHLELLTRDQAKDALLRPAELLSSGFDADSEARILGGLSGADHRIDPFLLSLTTQLVWNHAAPAHAEPRPAIRWSDVSDALKLPENTAERALMERAVSRALDLAIDGRPITQQFDMLELIGSLATTAGTRLITPVEQLMDRPMRRKEPLKEALDALRDKGLVRLQETSRGPGGDQERAVSYAEVRHDRLLAPARQKLQRLSRPSRLSPSEEDGDVEKRRNRAALPSALSLLMASPLSPLDLVDDGLQDRLPAYVRDAIRDNLDLVELDQPSALLILAGVLEDRLPVGGTDARERWTSYVTQLVDAALAGRGIRRLELHSDPREAPEDAPDVSEPSLPARLEAALLQQRPSDWRGFFRELSGQQGESR